MKKILRLSQVVERCGISKSTIFRMEKDNSFPKAVLLGKRAKGYFENEINDWIGDRKPIKASLNTDEKMVS